MSANIKSGGRPTVDMVSIEVDGVPMQATKGSMIIESTDKVGIGIPRFCYHRKLSIAANCRMCLVDVEKSPKPMPACATPVMEGMKIYTRSRRAIDAQHGVMEFLLINHPLDCPVCDQGGECELQDLAMGYGRSLSRFTERKRVVKDKNVGSLVQTDMTRCIHCTRCIRFLEEIAGTCEMGGSGRGDRLEIGTLVEHSIDSELSGNIIDLCPVGALTNKPFRFSARAWELMARPSVGAHDGVGSRLYYHTRAGTVMRAVPQDAEERNETWLSDRDRYSHFGLYSADRATRPLLKKEGRWQEVNWDEAMQAAVSVLREVSQNNPDELYALMSPGAATEEYYLAQKLIRALGSRHIDHRLREQDFRDDDVRPIAPVFDCKQAQIEQADAVLLVGCNPRHEAPLIGHRLRKAALAGARVSLINPLAWEFLFNTVNDIVVAPQFMLNELLKVAVAVAEKTAQALPQQVAQLAADAVVQPRHAAIAGQLIAAERGLLLFGQFATSHHEAAALRRVAGWIAAAAGCSLNTLSHGANSNGAWLAGAVPHRGPGGSRQPAGLHVSKMLQGTDKTWLLWDFEPDFDVADPAALRSALGAARRVIAVTSFASDSIKAVADIILPLAPWAESEGSLVNFDGETTLLAGAGRINGEARPGWKILRRLGDSLGLEGFAQVSLAELHQQVQAAIETAPAHDPEDRLPELLSQWPADGFYRVGEVPMYSVDALCRRAEPLQHTVHAQSRFVGLNPADATQLGLSDGGKARVGQGNGFAELEVRVSDTVPVGAAWVRSATCETRELAAAVGPISVEAA